MEHLLSKVETKEACRLGFFIWNGFVDKFVHEEKLFGSPRSHSLGFFVVSLFDEISLCDSEPQCQGEA